MKNKFINTGRILRPIPVGKLLFYAVRNAGPRLFAVLFVMLLLMMPCMQLNAHTINYVLGNEQPQTSTVIFNYLKLGFLHIIPLGLDHILFILCVFFLNTNLKKIILQATMFTVAHSITLGLAMYGVIQPPGEMIEPLIALSIVLLAIENIFFSQVKPWRLAMVFLFGLVHGMGFAGALSELGLPSGAFVAGLFSFNIGVELGQLSIILFMYYLVSRNFSGFSWYRPKLVVPASVLIAIVAGWWTVDRII